MEQVWNSVLQFLSQFVTPDWGSFVTGLMPLLVVAGALAFVLAMLGVIFLMPVFAPERRGRRSLPPIPPPGVHEGQPSIAPLLVAIGAAILFFGIVFRGPILAAGIVVLVAALLYWGREAMRDYQRLESHGATAAVDTGLRPLESLAGRTLPRLSPPAEPAATGPTAAEAIHDAHAAHMPVPSFRPILVSIGAAVVFFGLVFGPPILLAGVVMLAIALFGWLADARTEYRAIAGDTAALEREQSAPRVPVGTLVLFAVILIVAIGARTGLPFAGSAGGGAASPAAQSSGGTGGTSTTGNLSLIAKNIQFDVKSLDVPANKAFTIAFDNQDPSTPHNVAIHKGSPTGQQVWQGTIITGPAKTTYDVPALPAGTYAFVCSVHPNTMYGTLTVK